MDRRSLLAIVICMAIFFAWTTWVMPWLYPPSKAPSPVVPARPGPAEASATSAPVPAVPLPAPAPAELHAVEPPFELQSRRLRVVLTNQGAGIRELAVLDPAFKTEVLLLRSFDERQPHFALRRLGGPEGEAPESLPWKIVERSGTKAEFRLRLRDGLELTKVFELHPERHTLKATLLLDNKNPAPEGKSSPDELPARFDLLAFNGMDPDSAYRVEQYLAGTWKYDRDVYFKLEAEVKKGEEKLAAAASEADPEARRKAVEAAEEYLAVKGGRKEWFGLKSRFFALLVQPDAAAREALDSYRFATLPAGVVAKYREAGRGETHLAAYARSADLRVGGRKVLQFEVFAGPQKTEVLADLPGAQELLKFSTGCFLSPIVNLVAPLILGLLKLTGGLLGNFGVGIIVTTLLIKAVVFPLTLKSQRSMFAMQQLGPKIQALREKYGKDQQKFGMEQMKLFREHKINPLAGCLPMLIQMPVFIGMYSVFEQAVELRQAPFFLWMRDLSQPDHLIGPWTPVEIPLIFTSVSIDAFNLLPIVMTLTWFLQAYFTPRSPDPQMASQQKMMMFMPVLFGLMCYKLASGLSLYFLVNSLLGMGEMKLIKKVFLPKPEPVNP